MADEFGAQEYLQRAASACEQGDLVLGMHLYLAAYEEAAALSPGVANNTALTSLREAWNLACELKERSMAEYVFEKIEPFLTGEEIAHYANRLQDLALDRLEEYGFSREELQDMAEMISQDFLDSEGSILKVESISIPRAAIAGSLGDAEVWAFGEGGHAAAAFADSDFEALEDTAGEPAATAEAPEWLEQTEPSEQVERDARAEHSSERAERAEQLKKPEEIGMGVAPSDFNPYDYYDTSSVGKSYHVATNDGSGSYVFTRDEDRARLSADAGRAGEAAADDAEDAPRAQGSEGAEAEGQGEGAAADGATATASAADVDNNAGTDTARVARSKRRFFSVEKPSGVRGESESASEGEREAKGSVEGESENESESEGGAAASAGETASAAAAAPGIADEAKTATESAASAPSIADSEASTARASAPSSTGNAQAGQSASIVPKPGVSMRESKEELPSMPDLSKVEAPSSGYRDLAGYHEAITVMRELGVGLQRDPGFLRFVKMMNSRHGISRMPGLDTLLFRSPVVEDAARFVDATIAEIGLPVVRMSMEEGMQGAPMLCVTMQGNSRPRMNHANNRFDGPGILVIDDLDTWVMPQVPENAEGIAGFMMANISRGAREAMNFIRSAVEDPDVFVLATSSMQGEVDPYFYEALEPISIIDIGFPNEQERKEIWREVMNNHPSMRTLDMAALLRYSAGLARYDIYMAARAAIEEAYKLGLAQRKFLSISSQNILDKLAACQPLDSDEYQAIEDAIVEDFRAGLDDLGSLEGLGSLADGLMNSPMDGSMEAPRE